MSDQIKNTSNSKGFPATVFPVFIASPNDVEPERQIIHEVLYQWNTLHSREKRIVFLPTDWKNSSYPESGISPQQAINKQVLKNADLLIGVFWSRLGTATENYPSGSIEEYTEHIKLHKPAMLYFSKADVPQKNIADEQYRLLQKFKDSCQKQSLYREYEKEKFNEILYNDLTNMVNKNSYFVPAVSENLSTLQSNEIQLDTLARNMLLKTNEMNTEILYLKSMGGINIGPNGHYVALDYDQKREIANYVDALESLQKNGLIKDKGNKGEIFEITKKGYEWIDRQDANRNDNR